MRPEIQAYLRSHVDKLRSEAEVANSQEHLKVKPCPNSLRQVPSLDIQITELIASLPPLQWNRKWSMSEFVARLEGRYRDRPHPQMIAAALRRLGWRSKRDWTNNGGGRRYWTK